MRGNIVRRWIPLAMVRSASALLVARAVAQVSLLGVSVLLARVVGPSDFGAYSAVVAMGTVIVAGVGSGIPVLALRRVAVRDFDRSLIRRLGSVQVLVGAVATAAVAGICIVILSNPNAFRLGVASGAGFTAFSMMALASSIHAGAGRYRTAAAGEAGAALAFAVFSVVAIGAGYGIMGALVAFCLGQAGSATYLWWKVGDLFRQQEVAAVSSFKPMDALPFLALGLAANGYARLDAVLVATVATTATVGLYAAAYRLLGLFSLLGGVFGTLFLSCLSALPTGGPEWTRLKKRGTMLFAATALPLMLVAFALAPAFISILYGAEFAGAATPTRWLLLSVVPYSLYLPRAFALVASGQEKRWSLLLLVGSVANLLAVLLLVPQWGPTGAAVSWTIAESVILVGAVASVRTRDALLPSTLRSTD